MKIFTDSYGCSANHAESEIINGILEKCGHKIINTMEDSDLVIFNTCFVKLPTENKIKTKIKKLVNKHPEKKIIISGCMPEVMYNSLKTLAPKAGFVSTHNITKIGEAVEKISNGMKPVLIGKTKEKKLLFPKSRKNSVVGITEISQGCNGNCSYCCVRLAKGHLFSYSISDIINDVKKAVSDGCNEIWITSQDNAAFSSGNDNLIDLLTNIFETPGIQKNEDIKIRIGMMNPDNVLNIVNELKNIYENPKIYRFLHLPVQSGSDTILKKMNRRYKVADFVKIIKDLGIYKKTEKSVSSKAHPLPLTLLTDVIVGFPGETNDDFMDTIKLLKKIRPDAMFVSKFTPRPGTAAKEMKQVDNKIIKERSAILSRIAREIELERNQEWIGWKGRILVSERGNEKGQYVGRNQSYKPVIIKSEQNIMGENVDVEIIDAKVTHLYGKILGEK